jgi:DNA end-binding protein Ku
MAAIWKGSISFGLVNIPVQLETAVRSDDHISFRQLHKDDLSPIRYERVCEKEGEPVPYEDIVKGYEYEKGKYVVLTREEVKAAALESSSTIDILDFVGADEIDPRYFEKPYFILPAKGGDKPYALLREAIRETGMVGIGKFVMRQKQHLVALKVVGDALVLETMRFQNELADIEEYDFPSADVVRPQELKMAEQLVQNLAETFDPGKYVDDHRERLMKLIEEKLEGKEITVVESEAPEATRVVDLMERLRESIAQGKRDSGGGERKSSSARAKPRKTAARKKKSA